MTPLDDELRALLTSRADAQPPSPDPLAGVEARAARIRRGRVARAVAGTALAVGLVGVGVPLALDHTDVAGGEVAATAGPATPAPGTPAPTTPTPASPTPASSAPGRAAPQTPTPAAPSATPFPDAASAAFALDPADPWPFRGDEEQLHALPAVRDAFAAEHGAGWDLTPLWAQYDEPSGTPTIAWLATRGQAARWGVSQGDEESGVELRHDQVLAPGATALLAALPGDEVGRLLILASPDAQLLYGRGQQALPAGHGVDDGYREPYSGAPGIGIRSLEGDISDDRVQVFRAAGADEPTRACKGGTCGLVLVSDQPAPDPQVERPAVDPQRYRLPADAPSNVLDWPHRGVLDSGPDGPALSAGLGAALGGGDDALADYHVLLEGTDESGRSFAVGQAWLSGGRAHSFAYSLPPGADPETPGTAPDVFVGPVLPRDTQVLAFLLASATPGQDDPTLVVVPDPDVLEVRYAPDEGAYRVVRPSQEDLFGAVILARDPEASDDRLRVLFGGTEPHFDSPVPSLLCGLEECG